MVCGMHMWQAVARLAVRQEQICKRVFLVCFDVSKHCILRANQKLAFLEPEGPLFFGNKSVCVDKKFLSTHTCFFS